MLITVAFGIAIDRNFEDRDFRAWLNLQLSLDEQPTHADVHRA
jgi:hypothetical protein